VGFLFEHVFPRGPRASKSTTRNIESRKCLDVIDCTVVSLETIQKILRTGQLKMSGCTVFHIFDGPHWFVQLFDPRRIDLEQVSAQTLDSEPKSCN